MRMDENKERAQNCRKRIKNLSRVEEQLTAKLQNTIDAQQ